MDFFLYTDDIFKGRIQFNIDAAVNTVLLKATIKNKPYISSKYNFKVESNNGLVNEIDYVIEIDADLTTQMGYALYLSGKLVSHDSINVETGYKKDIYTIAMFINKFLLNLHQNDKVSRHVVAMMAMQILSGFIKLDDVYDFTNPISRTSAYHYLEDQELNNIIPTAKDILNAHPHLTNHYQEQRKQIIKLIKEFIQGNGSHNFEIIVPRMSSFLIAELNNKGYIVVDINQTTQLITL